MVDAMEAPTMPQLGSMNQFNGKVALPTVSSVATRCNERLRARGVQRLER